MMVSDEDSLRDSDFVAFGCAPLPRVMRVNPRITEAKVDSLGLSLHYLDNLCRRFQTWLFIISAYLIRERGAYSNVWTITVSTVGQVVNSSSVSLRLACPTRFQLKMNTGPYLDTAESL